MILGNDSPSASLFWVSFWACVGGVVVFIGLAMEKIAEWKEEKYAPPFFKPWKRLDVWGWRLLMLGIAVEICVSGKAAKDDWETRQAQIRNDPHNLPIEKFSAFAWLEVRPLEPVENLGNLLRIAGSSGPNGRFKNTNSTDIAWLDLGTIEKTNGRYFLISLASDNVSKGLEVDKKLLIYDMYFGKMTEDDFSVFQSNPPLTANNLNAVKIKAPIHCEVITGMVVMTINSSVEKDFPIPAQTTFREAATSTITTNGAFVPLTVEQLNHP